MATFVLIHGAGHGAWCWRKLVPRLQRAGHRALAPDLPGHGDDRTPLEQLSLELYVETVAGMLRRRPEPVILVGHSLGGLTVTQTAEAVPEKISRLVYVSAFLLTDGEAARDGRHDNSGSLLRTHRTWNEDETAYAASEEGLRELFYGDCDDDDVAFARANLVWEPEAPAATPMRTTPERFARLPRAFVECTQDRCLTLDFQRSMQAALPCDPVFTLDSAHSPFFSMPDELAECLLSLPEAGAAARPA
jgi:pimeloyl-ACP methyl ester carboxylesterase